jgi:hypothetical protein
VIHLESNKPFGQVDIGCREQKGNTSIGTLGNPQRLRYHGTAFRGLDILVDRSIPPTAFDGR